MCFSAIDIDFCCVLRFLIVYDNCVPKSVLREYNKMGLVRPYLCEFFLLFILFVLPTTFCQKNINSKLNVKQDYLNTNAIPKPDQLPVIKLPPTTATIRIIKNDTSLLLKEANKECKLNLMFKI